jgi:hypothetical protein
MKNIILAKVLIVLNIVYIVIYNSYFGWNLHPVSDAEKICDIIVHYVDAVAIFIYLLPLAHLYEAALKKLEDK